MLNIEFKGVPYLFVGENLDEDGAITTPEDFQRGLVSFAHYYAHSGLVKRYREVIGKREDITVIAEAQPINMTLGGMLEALDNMLGGDPRWFAKPKAAK